MSRISTLLQLLKDLLPSKSEILTLSAASRRLRGKSDSRRVGFLTCLSLLGFD